MDIDSPNGGESEAIDSKTQQRYRVFKKNSPFLYDYLFTSSLVWPSLTVLFFPDLELRDSNALQNASKDNNSQYVTQRLLLGTFTSGQATDSISIDLLIYHDQLNKNININQWNYNQEKQEFEIATIPKTKFVKLQTINHDGDVNKLTYMPQNPDVIASVNNVGDLSIYNRTKHSTVVRNTKANLPQLRLINKTQNTCSETFAVDWNKQKEGVIVSGAMDGLLNVYDIKHSYDSRTDDCIESSWSYQDLDGINDVEWIPDHDSIFVSGNDLGVISLLDIRSNEKIVKIKRTGVAVNSVSVNPTDSFSLATGDAEGMISLWDLRNLEYKVADLNFHSDSITQLKWHPKYRSVLGSSSADRLVKIFNLANSSEKLLFSHEGHMLGVNDFDWSRHVDWMVASVSDDNSVHVWQPAKHLIPNFV